MGHQFRLSNRNEDSNPTQDRDDRALRYFLASNSSSNSSSPRLFGSSLTTHPSPMYPSIAQLGTAPSNYHQLQSRATNNNVDESAIVTSTDTRNASFKRSRSPDFMRGESSNQGSQVGGTLRRRINPHITIFQQESVNNNNMSSTPLSTQYNYNGNNDMLRQQVNQNSITGESHPINPRPAHAGPAGFFDDTPSYNNPTQSIIDEEVGRLLFPYQQETYRASFSVIRRSELAYVSTSTTSLRPFAITGGITHATLNTSPFQMFNNNNNNFELFDSIQHRTDDTFVHSTINVQQYIRLLPGGRVSRFFAPSIVPLRSNSFVPQSPFDPSTTSYHLNPHLSNNHILTSTSPELRAQRNRLRDQVFRSLQHLRTGGSMRIEDLLILDYSIVLNVLDSQELMDMLHNIDDWPYEEILNLEEYMGSVERGLTEEEILTYIETEIHVSNPNETNTQNKTCTICQEDYVEGEIIGRLDCRHIYHLECIKQWLLLKNECPICKQIALEVDEEED